jgi:hypothetical protein
VKEVVFRKSSANELAFIASISAFDMYLAGEELLRRLDLTSYLMSSSVAIAVCDNNAATGMAAIYLSFIFGPSRAHRTP